MRQDRYGQIIYSEDDICNMLMSNPERLFDTILVDKMVKFDRDLELDNLPKFVLYQESAASIDEFDQQNQSNWFMPEEYRQMDIAAWVLEQCTNDAELQRAGQELLLFFERGMEDLLRYMKYLVDTMRQNNIVWGVGRGSSVASFVLYIIGVHKINSLYYDLSIDEFLK